MRGLVCSKSGRGAFRLYPPPPFTNSYLGMYQGRNACIREMNRGFHVDPQSGCALVDLSGSVKWSLDLSQVNHSFLGIEFGTTSDLGFK